MPLDHEIDKLVAANLDGKILVRPKEGAWRLSLKNTTFAGLLKSGEIPSFMCGRCRLVRVADLEQWASRKR